MQLRFLLLVAVVGAVAASKGHGVHHLTDASFAEKTGDGKASHRPALPRPPRIAARSAGAAAAAVAPRVPVAPRGSPALHVNLF